MEIKHVIIAVGIALFASCSNPEPVVRYNHREIKSHESTDLHEKAAVARMIYGR